MANFRAGGLIKGLGRGMGQVADRMFQRERDLADEYKARRLARFSHGLSEQSAENQRGFAAGEAEKGRDFSAEQAGIGRDFTAEQAGVGREFTAEQGVLTREAAAEQARLTRENAATNAIREISTYDKDGNPITITIDAKGNEVRSDQRGPSAAEASVANAKLKGLNTKADIKAAVWNQTNDAVLSDEFSDYAAKAAKGGDINSFWAQFMDPENKFNMNAALAHMRANDPEAHERYTTKRSLMDKALGEKMSQGEAIDYAHSEYDRLKGKATKTAKGKVAEATYKAAGITKTVADAWGDLPQNDATVTSWSQEMMEAGKTQQGADKFTKKLLILQGKNLWLYQQIIAERQRMIGLEGRTKPAGLINSSTPSTQAPNMSEAQQRQSDPLNY